jgi:recombination protein RecT
MASASGGNQALKNQVATQGDKKQMTVQDFFEQQMPNIAAVLPKGTMDPQRMVKLAIQIWTGNDKLAACTKSSFLAALITCAQFGLEPNTPLGQCYIIPYARQATFQMGYQGLLSLAYRTGEYKSIYIREVYKDDEFKVTYGIFEDLEHVPSEDGPADKELPTHIYAVYHLKNGGYSFECWSWNKIIKHAKKFSKSFNKADGGWQTNPVAMAKKTVLIALLKYAPKSLEMSRAMEADNTTQVDVGAKREYIDADFTVKDDAPNDDGQPAGTPQEPSTESGELPPATTSDPQLDFEKAMNQAG